MNNADKREVCLVEGYYRPICRHYANEDALEMVLEGNYFPESCTFECKVTSWEIAKKKEF